MMRPLPLLDGVDSATILFLGAHSDDIEIGCGATILGLVEAYPDARFRWVVFSADETRSREARASAAAFLGPDVNCSIEVHSFRESYFPYVGTDLKDAFEELKSRIDPDVVFTHCLEDRHQDHRVIAELTHNTFRDHLLLEYEIPKFDGDLVPTTLFVPITRRQLERKNELLMEHFASQRSRAWFDPETFAGLARLRGVECNAPDGLAEGFRTRTLQLH